MIKIKHLEDEIKKLKLDISNEHQKYKQLKLKKAAEEKEVFVEKQSEDLDITT